MQRLGETHEWGSAIAALFAAAGWELQPPMPALGGGSLFFATKVIGGEEIVVKRSGATFADVATDMLQDALWWARPRVDAVQLELPIGTA